MKVKAASDADEVSWMELNELPPLGFDHAKIIDFAYRNLELRS